MTILERFCQKMIASLKLKFSSLNEATIYSWIRKSSVPILLISLFALAVRIQLINITNMWGYDPYAYLGLAKITIDGQPMAWAYPQVRFVDIWGFAGLVFISEIIEGLFGLASFVTSRYFMAIIGTIGVCVAYLISTRIFDRQTAIVSSILLSVSPWYLAHSTTLYPDVYFFVISAICLYFFISKRSVSFLDYYHIGIIFLALSFLTRPYTFLMIPSLLLSIWLGESDRRKALRIGFYVLIVALLFAFNTIYRAFLISGDPFSVNLLYTRFSILDQIFLFNPDLLYNAVFVQLANQLTQTVLILGLLGITLCVMSRNRHAASMPIILYVFLYIFYIIMFYSPYTHFYPEDMSLQSLLTELPPRVLIPIQGFVVIFAGGFFVHIVRFIKNIGKRIRILVKYQNKWVRPVLKIRYAWIINSFFLIIIIFTVFALVSQSFLEGQSYVTRTSEYEDRYNQLASWIDSNVTSDDQILVSFSWKIWNLISPDLRNQILDISNTPINKTDFLHYLIENKDIRYVVYDPLWTGSRVRFDQIPENLMNDIFKPVFSYATTGTPLMVYENLLQTHAPHTVFSVWDFDGETSWHLAGYPIENGYVTWGIEEAIGRDNTKGLFINHIWGIMSTYIEQREYVQFEPNYDKGSYLLEPVFPETNYTISFWLKGQDFQANIAVRPGFFDFQGNYIGELDWMQYNIPTVGDFNWKQYSFTFNTGRAFFILIRIQIGDVANGGLIIDDVTLEKH